MRELARVKVELIRVAIRIHMVRHYVHRRHLMFLLPLHTSVLEPDLDLSLREAERVCDLDPSPPRKVPVEVELFLQLKRLVPGVRRPLAFRFPVGVHCTWKHYTKFISMYHHTDDLASTYLLHKFVKYYSGHKTQDTIIFRTECPFERQWIVGSIDFVPCYACSIVMYSSRQLTWFKISIQKCKHYSAINLNLFPRAVPYFLIYFLQLATLWHLF